MIPTEHERFIVLLSRCIAQTLPEFHAGLCREFRIPPQMVVDAIEQYDRDIAPQTAAIRERYATTAQKGGSAVGNSVEESSADFTDGRR